MPAVPPPDAPPGETTSKDELGRDQPRLPHEHDESGHSQESGPRKVIRQAYDDVQSGQEDTDLRSTRGQRVDVVPKNTDTESPKRG
ncbi:hypothetical protein GCM10023144_13180 [Pigmentiphaga soli]|uniref:Uncharacterized protein n=1 Tax=Pigmentiphaga soli TaxID=1007095 RepID=A0ABP8GP64_9BURK